MNLLELLKNNKFMFATNVELKLYKLAESLGIDKQDILSGKYDKEFEEAKSGIFAIFRKYFDRGEDKQ